MLLRVMTLCVVGAVLVGLSGCIDAMEDAARNAAKLAEDCGGQSKEHQGDMLLPLSITNEGTFEVPHVASLLVLHGQVSASEPGIARVQVRAPSDAIVFDLEAGPGTEQAEGVREIMAPEPGRYTVHGTGTPEGEFHLQVFVAGCGGTDHGDA